MTRIAIVGGGMAGLALGAFLERRGLACTIYEARSADDIGGVGFGLAPNGMRVLRELGLDERIRADGSAYIGFQFSRSDGHVLTRYSDQNGVVDKGVAIRRESLLGALRSAYRGPIHYESRIETIEAGLVIGADGINSSLRREVAPSVRPSYTGLVGLGGIIDGEHAPDGYMSFVFGSRGFFGVTRVGHGQSMWWSALASEHPLDVRHRPVDELRALLLERHRGWVAPVEEMIERAPQIFADNLFDVSDLPTWHRSNVCLIGDAAHAVSPHSGQGVSQALEDAWVLAQEIARTPSPDAFVRFESRRRARVERVIKYGRQSGASKKELGPLGLWMRDKFISLAMPAFARSTAKWMYLSPLDAAVDEQP